MRTRTSVEEMHDHRQSNATRYGGYAIVPRWVLDTCDSVKEIAVYTALAAYADKDRRCYPQHSTIAKDAKCSPRSVQRALNALQDKGVLTWKKGFFDPKTGKSAPNNYILATMPKAIDKSDRPIDPARDYAKKSRSHRMVTVTNEQNHCGGLQPPNNTNDDSRRLDGSSIVAEEVSPLQPAMCRCEEQPTLFCFVCNVYRNSENEPWEVVIGEISIDNKGCGSALSRQMAEIWRRYR